MTTNKEDLLKQMQVLQKEMNTLKAKIEAPELPMFETDCQGRVLKINTIPKDKRVPLYYVLGSGGVSYSVDNSIDSGSIPTREVFVTREDAAKADRRAKTQYQLRLQKGYSPVYDKDHRFFIRRHGSSEDSDLRISHYGNYNEVNTLGFFDTEVNAKLAIEAVGKENIINLINGN